MYVCGTHTRTHVLTHARTHTHTHTHTHNPHTHARTHTCMHTHTHTHHMHACTRLTHTHTHTHTGRAASPTNWDSSTEQPTGADVTAQFCDAVRIPSLPPAPPDRVPSYPSHH